MAIRYRVAAEGKGWWLSASTHSSTNQAVAG
jgi:hypothetical protein